MHPTKIVKEQYECRFGSASVTLKNWFDPCSGWKSWSFKSQVIFSSLRLFFQIVQSFSFQKKSFLICLFLLNIETVDVTLKLAVILCFRHEYQIFQKITKLEYEFPDGFSPVARDLVEKFLVSSCYFAVCVSWSTCHLKWKKKKLWSLHPWYILLLAGMITPTSCFVFLFFCVYVFLTCRW